MSIDKIGLGPERDEDVSPAQAQNDGPARVGPAAEPLPQKKANEADRQTELERGRVSKGGPKGGPKGGNASLRDDG